MLTIFRGSGGVGFSLNEIMQTFTVALQKQPCSTFGLVLEDHFGGSGVIISNIVSLATTGSLTYCIISRPSLSL